MEPVVFHSPARGGPFSENPVDLDGIWEQIRSIVDQVFSVNSMDEHRLMELYRQAWSCFSSINEHNGPGNSASQLAFDLNRGIYYRLSSYLNIYITNLFEKFNELYEKDLLCAYNFKWEEHKHKSRALDSIFSYMNNWIFQAFKLCETPVADIFQLCILTWRNVLAVEENNALIVTPVLEIIERERDGEQINTSLISEVVRSYIELGSLGTDHPQNGPILSFYEEAFEKFFLEESKCFYHREVNALTMDDCEIDFWSRAQQRLSEERARVKCYLHESTEEKLIRVCENLLMPQHIENLMAGFSF